MTLQSTITLMCEHRWLFASFVSFVRRARLAARIWSRNRRRVSSILYPPLESPLLFPHVSLSQKEGSVNEEAEERQAKEGLTPVGIVGMHFTFRRRYRAYTSSIHQPGIQGSGGERESQRDMDEGGERDAAGRRQEEEEEEEA